jgi:AcrR family transcriptional regulator
MCQADAVHTVDEVATGGRAAEQRAAICAAAIEVFAARGFSGTSMVHIAQAAGLSRPALYQYFDNKRDVFTSAFVLVFEQHAQRALAELVMTGPVAERLDAFLQRFDGDLWERLAASPYADDLMSAKDDALAAELSVAQCRLRAGLATYLSYIRPGRSAAARRERDAWIDLLRMSPLGFKADAPAVAIYRRRLTALAHSVSAAVCEDHRS